MLNIYEKQGETFKWIFKNKLVGHSLYFRNFSHIDTN